MNAPNAAELPNEERIALDCPYCHEPLYQPLGWFKRPYGTCPHCQQGLAAGQFAVQLSEVEAALDAAIEEQLQGKAAGCGCGKGGCSASH